MELTLVIDSNATVGGGPRDVIVTTYLWVASSLRLFNICIENVNKSEIFENRTWITEIEFKRHTHFLFFQEYKKWIK